MVSAVPDMEQEHDVNMIQELKKDILPYWVEWKMHIWLCVVCLKLCLRGLKCCVVMTCSVTLSDNDSQETGSIKQVQCPGWYAESWESFANYWPMLLCSYSQLNFCAKAITSGGKILNVKKNPHKSNFDHWLQWLCSVNCVLCSWSVWTNARALFRDIRLS